MRAVLLVGLALTSAGCFTLSMGTGLAVGPEGARDAVTPTFSFGVGVALEIPHDVRPSDDDSPRSVRVATGFGLSLVGMRTAAASNNAITGPVFLRTDVTVLPLGEHALLRATLMIDGPGTSLESDPQGAIGTYDVPRSVAWSFLGGPTLQLVAGDEGSLFFTTGVRVHALSGDRFESTTLWGPELLVAADLDMRRLIGGGRD